MGVTAGDGLPWPELADAGNVPQDMQELAAATQTALNARMTTSLAAAPITYQAGWIPSPDAYGGLVVYKTGQLVVASGVVRRSANLTVADNTIYPFADLPAGFIPATIMRAAGSWVCLTGGVANQMTTQIVISSSLSLVSNVAGTFRANSDWISIAGISWLTAT